MKIKFSLFFLITLCTLFSNVVISQCTGCTITYNGSGATSFSLTNNQRLCITGNATNLSITISGTGTSICLAPGITWSQNGLTFDQPTTLLINGNLTLTGGINANAGVSNINVNAGGSVSDPNSSFSQNLAINNAGTYTLTSTSTIQITSSIVNSGTLISNTSPNVNLSNGSLTNSGIVTFNNFENSGGAVLNTSTGVITIRRRFYNHGDFENNGQVATLCSTLTGAAQTYACGLEVGDKGFGQTFRNFECVKILGNVDFIGAGTNDGTIDIQNPSGSTGNFTVNKTFSGSGRVYLRDGVSTLNINASYTAARFYDVNTVTPPVGGVAHGFDVRGTGSTFTSTIDGSALPANCGGPAAISIDGNVFNDVNGNAVKDGAEPFITNGSVWANLVDPATNDVIQSVQVQPGGTYTFPGVSQSTVYKIILSSSSQAGNLNLTTATLPAGFVHTGVNLGGTANTSNQTGIISFTTGSVNITNQNFAIEQPPTAGSGSNSAVNPNGTVQVTVPANTFT
ncbi:MAG: hypothetical protein V4722_24270, partial [Bacteroidota bacterium]